MRVRICCLLAWISLIGARPAIAARAHKAEHASTASDSGGKPRAQTSQSATSTGPAATVLTQALNAIGGATALSSVQDFTATGTITYYWAGEQVRGSATVRGRGVDQFRLDANLRVR